MFIIEYAVFLSVVAFFALTVRYSILSRMRKKPSMDRGLSRARMNISMGAMLLAIACMQILFQDPSVPRVIFGVVCLLLGAFNVFAGIRNKRVFLNQIAQFEAKSKVK